MHIKIVSDGTRRRTKVVNAETGEEIEGVISVKWVMDITDVLAFCTLECMAVPADIEADAVKIGD